MTARHLWRVYMPFAKSEVQRRLSYRASFFFWMIAAYLYIVVNYFLWKAIYDSSGALVLRGFTFQEMVVYIILIFVVGGITSTPAGWIIGSEVADGSIAMNLIRPINYQLRIFFCAVGGNIASVVSFNLPLIVLLIIGFGDVTSPTQFAFFVVSVLLSFLITFFFDLCFAMISFYTTYMFGLNMLKDNLIRFLSGGLIPFAFFSDGFRTVFELLPFSGIAYTPVMIFLGKYTGGLLWRFLGLQVFWACFFGGLSLLLWRWAVKRLTILGG